MASKLKRIGQIISEAAPAVKACSNLLPWWERSDSDWYSTTSSRKFALQRRVGEIGADLYPDALQYIWERAGGEIKNLKLYDTPRSCWQNAVSLAAKGALSDGLLSIVRELKKDFPGNRELMELEKALK